MKPMLAAATDGTNLTFPLLASPKLDGVRAVIMNGKVLSRSLKPIPNKYVQKLFGKRGLNGLDGELVVGKATAEDVFRQTSSGVMSIEGEPKVCFHVFDRHDDDRAFKARVDGLKGYLKTLDLPGVKLVPHKAIKNRDQLEELEAKYLEQGYEGVMLRSLDGPYKHGRSTVKQGWLLKLKRFEDSEAKVVGITELMHNANEAKQNELGQKARSHKKEGLVGKAMMGALKVKDLKTGVQFEIGTGFSQKERKELWILPPEGRIVKYRYFPGGVKDKPRFPVFVGFRDKKDL